MHRPYVPADQTIPEITVRAVLLGILLGILLGAANTYLGLYAGMTVSASIPAAVLSMAILRGVLKRGTILENNIVQTIAASGESLAAGIIFTVPALLIVGVWTDIQFWPTTLICLAGGLLGICFMVPLRRSHIVDDPQLTYPEGCACADVLIAGEEGGKGARTILLSIVLGGVFKFLSVGVGVFKASLEWAGRIGQHPVFFGADVSGALLGVGYIVGLNVAVLSFLGGVLAWGIAIPFFGDPIGPQEALMDWFWAQWGGKIRYLGVGAMIIGGIWSIFAIRVGIGQGVREALLGYREAAQSGRGRPAATPRTEQNIKRRHLAMLLVAAFVMTAGLYYSLIQSVGLTLFTTVASFVMAFFFVAVGSYVCGLVGSSNSPVSGITISALLATAGLMLLFGFTGDKAIVATLGVAGVIACAVCSAGDISQDLKTGYLIGATPRSQQWMEVLGAAIPAFVVAPVLTALHHAYGIGTGAPGSLKAPQANLFANIVKGIFGSGDLPWSFVAAGAVLGAAIIAIDLVLQARKSSFRLPVMAVAVGMYLPLTLSVPIFVGGLVSAFTRDRSEAGRGALFASGLIAGEAIIGVLVGFVVYLNKDALPLEGPSSATLSVLALLGLAGALVWVGRRRE
jgi:putative OPT family oligopeptide transporter